jgi:putative flippase GtrA
MLLQRALHGFRTLPAREGIERARRWLLIAIRMKQLRLFRYFIAGVAVSSGYTLTVVVLVDGLHLLQPTAASVTSFVLWTPASYVLQRDFTFNYSGPNASALAKYGVSFLARMFVSGLAVHLATHYFFLHYLFGVFINWLVLPLINYVVLTAWVFRQRTETTT